MKKDNIRMDKTTYIKRIFAVVVSVAMLISMMPEVFVESFAASESVISESAVETSAGNTESTGQPDVADSSTGNAGSESTGTGEAENSVEQTEESILEESTGTEENDSFTDGETVAAEEETTETFAPDDAVSEELTSEETTEMLPEDLVEDEYEIELMLNLLSEGETTISTIPSLSLSDALRYFDAKGNAVISQEGDILAVDGAAGLILLSNVQPDQYNTLRIELKTTEGGWNVTGTYTYTVTSEGEESGSLTTIVCSFLGLGSENYPYAGTMTIATGSDTYSITANRALFNAISTEATLPSNINFMMAGKDSGQIVLADQVKKSSTEESTLNCTVTLTTGTGGEAATSDTIGGIIGMLEAGASVSVTLTNSLGTLTVSGGDNRGLFCNTMESGSSLTARLTNPGTISVIATSGDAGGYVGKMESGGTLTISGSGVNTVISKSGNAGGLVGSATDVTINVTGEPLFYLSGVTITAANNKSSGGLVGNYTNTTGVTLNLAQFILNTTLSGGTNAGGVFGVLTNSGNYTISNGSVTSSLIAGTNYGGLIGSYSANASENSLTISGIANQTVKSAGGDKATTAYGGVIGTVSGRSYVEIENVTASTKEMPGEKDDLSTSFGGLVGKMTDGLLNVGSVTLNSNNTDIAADRVDGRGGLVGVITKGVLRLHGITDLSSQKITTAYHHTGQIVGNNGNGLVYATGTGSDINWTLKRYSGANRSGSDIGNWGEVVRLDGSTLKEATGTGEDALFVFDQANHTVTVQGVTVNEMNTVTLTNTRDFAAYALAFNLNSGDRSGILTFQTNISSSATQNITLSGNVDLTGTGILGIGKDGNSDDSQAFIGNFDGGNNTITLDIGGKYGDGINTDSGNGSGQIYMRRAGGHECHTSMALFPYTNNATVSNLTVNGKLNCLIATNGDNSDAKWPVFAAGVVGNADGMTFFENITVSASVSVENEGDGKSKNLYVLQGGILGQYEGGNTLSFTDCSWTSTLINSRSTDNNRIGGFTGRVLGNSEVAVSGCTLGGTITADRISQNAAVGGLIAESLDRQLDGNNFNYTDGNIIISISNLTVSGERINTSAGTSCGGLLGYSWNKTDVTFAADTGSTGVSISGSTLNANSAIFGGLVYQATGYWNATAAGSIKFTKTEEQNANTFSGKSETGSPSGLLVNTGMIMSNSKNNALYLEVGTWGSEGAAYYIVPNSVTLTLNGSTATSESYFDELVGKTINKEKSGNSGNDNAIVSLAVCDTEGNAITIDKTACNTYTGQIANYQNGKTRYYYNLDSYRVKDSDGKSQVNSGSLGSPAQVLSWSVSQYAAENIRGYFCSNPNDGATISGFIDLTGYSYYPVSPLAGVTVTVNGSSLTFAYEEMNGKETGNKPFNESNQHYLMHHGLLYNTVNNVTVQNTSLLGNVGKESTNTTNKFNSGALIFGNISGDTSTSPVTVRTVQLKDVKLAGLRVSDVDSFTLYAPLLINTIGAAVTLTVDNLSTDVGYTKDNYAATSLIGNVGSSSAIKLTLTFSNIALDSRVSAGDNPYVWNNGESENHKVEYNTNRTIFTRATLLESFQYSADSSGVYNFNSDDTMVTYGVEISNTDSGRNMEKQYQYYNGGYVWDGLGTATGEETIKNYFSSESYLRYVNSVEGTAGGYHELDINQKATNLTEGCGTYGDPYIITDGTQLIDLAKFINQQTDISDFKVKFNTIVISAKKQETGSYHTTGNDENMDVIYTWNGTKWINEEGSDAPTDITTNALSYLLNAYYKISGSIDISIVDGSYQGLGTEINPFSGVITGGIVNIKGAPTTGKSNFSGLIRYSRGSVVKDLTVDYTGATITMNNTAVPSSSNNPFFGGVVGYCMGGDSIIDNVSVTYGTDSVNLSDNTNKVYDRLIAAGGYVGLVGGAKDSNGYEKNGGGVVFRNMRSHTNNFASVQTKAGDSGDGATYFYCNPYVGRVLDGYACYDGDTAGQSTLNNTDKNYIIPDVSSDVGGLTVDNSLSVTVNAAQGLWLLSAIVNSGAGAMDSNGSYTDVSGTVDAYQVGKPRSRTADYSHIGMSIADEEVKAIALADEVRWGGVAGKDDKDASRVSYLVSGFTAGQSSSGVHYAAQLSARSNISKNDSANNPVTLTFVSGTIDMSSYKNGFRGIGGSYGQPNVIWNTNSTYQKVYRRTLYVENLNGATSGTTLTLKMNQWDYAEEDNYSDKNNPGLFNQGAGLFTNFSYVDGCEVKNLTISGEVKLHTCKANDNGKESYADKGQGDDLDICVGAFAARTKNASGALTFDKFYLNDIEVYGGNQTGGIIGCVERSGGKKAVTFINWSMTDATIKTELYNNGGAGGLVGWYYGENKLTVQDGSVNSTNVITDSQGVNSNNVGGLVNGSNYEVGINNVTFSGLSVRGTNLNSAGGLIGTAQAKITVDNCTFSELSVKVTGSKYVGGLIGRSAGATTIQNTKIQCSNEKPAKIYNSNTSTDARTGGFIGYSSDGKTTTIENCLAEYLYVLSKSRTGGLFGQNSHKPVNIRNVKMDNAIVITSGTNKQAGLLAGYVGDNDKTINGYNILADSCKVGYCSTSDVTVDSLTSAEVTKSDYVGRWTGELKGGAISLVAVATNNGVLPDSDIGAKSSGTASIVYADYPADTTNWEGNNSASPYVDVNPKSDLTVKDTADATTFTTLTGNGVGTDVAYDILNEAKTGDSNRKYCNLTDGTDKTFSKFLDANNDVYLTTYQKEEKQNGISVPVATDFPILVVTGLANADTAIWNYIAALTNVKDIGTAKGQAESIAAVTYVWTANTGEEMAQDGTVEGSFVMVDGNTIKHSLTTENKTISITRDAYDNQQSQFTLLDVKYNDPTGGNPNGFHLYVPVLVKKVLYASFSAKFLAGTNYWKQAYTSSNATYATAGFDEPVTAYMEYNYDRSKSDWEKMLENGDNLLWNYDKVMDLAKGNNDTTPLPDGTRLTLVDKQTGQCYIHTFSSTEGDDVHRFDLSCMEASDGTEFKSVPICDLLNLTIDGTLNTAKTQYVSLGGLTDTGRVPYGATVKVGDTYYRKAEDGETEGRCTISVGSNLSNNTTGTNYLPQGEGYYLTIQVPSNSGASVVNNPLNVDLPTMRKTGAPLASIRDLISSTYVIYDGLEQSELTINTVRIKNGEVQADTNMEDGDSIQVTLTSTLSLTTAGKRFFSKYAPTELYHQFNINMKKYDKEGVANAVLIGATGAEYTYTIKRSDGTALYRSGETKNNSEFLDTLTIDSVSNDSDASRQMIEYLKDNKDGILTIQAVITLSYPTIGTYFPWRSSDDTNSGISVSADSRIATATTQLPITIHKEAKEDDKRYFTENPSSAKLTYNTYDGDGTGDSTRKLGINPSDTVNDLDGLIYTNGIYDYSGVDTETLNNARQIKYTLELFQKDNAGSYNESNPLSDIDVYLSSVAVTGNSQFDAGNKNGAKTLKKDFTNDSSGFDSINIKIKPLTGEDFENKGFTYANYKVRLTAVLLDEAGDELTGTKASDYIIYTNARIYQQMIQ